MKDFKIGMDRVWRNSLDGKKKLIGKDISDMYKEQNGDSLLISLDNCTLDKDTFSNCPFKSVTIVSGNNIDNLYFSKTGNNLNKVGVGKFADTGRDVPSVFGCKFPKLNKIELSNCPALEKFEIKSGLQLKIDVDPGSCPSFSSEDTSSEKFTLGINGVWKNGSNSKVD